MDLSVALGEPCTVVGPIGEAQGRASQRFELRTPTRHLVVKRSDDPEEVAREAAFYQQLAPRLDLLLPELHYADDTQIVLDFVAGEPGRSDLGCPAASLAAMAETLRVLHTSFPTRPAEMVFAPWAGSPMHRAQQVARSLPTFCDLFPRSPVHHLLADLPAVAALATERLGAMEHAVIHADLHVENVMFTAEGPVLLDWQTVSWGPPAVDVARFIVEGAGLDADFARLAGAPPGLDKALDVLLADIVCSRWVRPPVDEQTRAGLEMALTSWARVRERLAGGGD